MKFNIEFTNTIASLGWSFVVFALGGMIIVGRKK
jgi:hypothetical protein